MMNRSRTIRQYIEEHTPYYIFVSVLFLTGVIFGALLVNALTLDQKQGLVDFLGSFLHTIDQGGAEKSFSTFWQSFVSEFKWIILIWALGLSVIGLPLVLVLDFLKGVLIGFTVGFMVSELSWKGMLLALVSIAPQNLVLIPVIIISSVSAIVFSIHLVKSQFISQRLQIKPAFTHYSLTIGFMLLLTVVVSLFETYVSPIIIYWVFPYIAT